MWFLERTLGHDGHDGAILFRTEADFAVAFVDIADLSGEERFKAPGPVLLLRTLCASFQGLEVSWLGVDQIVFLCS